MASAPDLHSVSLALLFLCCFFHHQLVLCSSGRGFDSEQGLLSLLPPVLCLKYPIVSLGAEATAQPLKLKGGSATEAAERRSWTLQRHARVNLRGLCKLEPTDGNLCCQESCLLNLESSKPPGVHARNTPAPLLQDLRPSWVAQTRHQEQGNRMWQTCFLLVHAGSSGTIQF